jgi:hypothetical protein
MKKHQRCEDMTLMGHMTPQEQDLLVSVQWRGLRWVGQPEQKHQQALAGENACLC